MIPATMGRVSIFLFLLLISFNGWATSNDAKKALFTAAKISENKDEKKAIQIYNQFLREYPKDSMADNALFAIARLRFEKQNDRAKATRALNALLERYPNSDTAAPARKYLSAMEGKKEKKESDVLNDVRTIVIDPGHGGQDRGATGKRGTKEAEVTLQIARKLAFELKKKMGVKVFLSRTNQKGLSLFDRHQFSTAKNADLFISIHANANPSSKVSGVQTFYLNNATSEAAEELADRENKVAGKILSTPERILTTMLQNANTLESKELAHAVQASLVSRLQKNYSGIKDLNVETAIFQVLDGVRCPSIVVETSFITNPKEEIRLRDTNYQWALAEGIAKGIEKYIGTRKGSVTSSL